MKTDTKDPDTIQLSSQRMRMIHPIPAVRQPSANLFIGRATTGP
jgi:hypothetical protein